MPEKLYLVDGMSHLYRAYYAIQGLTSKSGRPTNAVFGFTNMLRKLIADERPEYLGVALDLGGPTVRHEKFEQYKATRRPMPPDLKDQVPDVRRVCEVLRVPVVTFEKYEADDVIATLTRKAVEDGLEVVIVTIDKDMFQLVNDHVSVLDTRNSTRLNAAGVEEKFGVPPSKVVDVLSLVGDSSDNIPGAPGIGEKGARQLIQEFGTLENLLSHADQVSRRTYRESLEQNREQILQSRELVTIHRDLPLELDLDALRLSEPDRSAARELFAELDFLSLLEEFLPSSAELKTAYGEAKNRKDVEDLAHRLQDCSGLAWHLDPSREGAASLQEIGISCAPGQGEVVRADWLGSEPFGWLGESAVVVHDLKTLCLFGFDSGVQLPKVVADTMLMAYLLNPNQSDFSLEKLSVEYLQYRFGEATAKGQKGLFAEVEVPRTAERADLTLQLYQQLSEPLSRQGMEQLFSEIEMPLVEVLARMEMIGVKVDTSILVEMSHQLEGEIEALCRSIYDLAGEEFNINSPKQLAYVLFEKMNLPVARKTAKAGHYATGVEVLEELANSFDIARLILEFRELSKLKNTYLDALPRLVSPKTGRIHTSYNQMVAATGRLSSSNPNLQNIPIKTELGRSVRRAFVAESGFCILAADYSQIELRVMAHLSRDPVLLDSFQRGEDIHERTAREVFGEAAQVDPQKYRRHAKVINFGIMYGLSAFGLSQSLKIDRREAQKFIDDYFQRYDGVKRWIDSTLQEVRETGVVRTLFGRVRPIPEIRSKNWNLRSFGERTAINAPIQGTAADLIKKAMVDIDGQLRKGQLKSRLIMQVHDELVFEVLQSELDEVRKRVVECMEKVHPLDVPLKVDVGVGRTWFDAK